ncbi:MAG TPA: 50S ribosomal protein L28 [Tissierellia bacterium]|nr:50S ribosomal protein L28 [Tissierellia bacterium]
MAKKCDICGKGRVFGNKVSFSNKKSNRSWAPNVRTVRAVINGATKRINVCTRCLRSGKVERAL